ncbi:MAG: ABC transporter ATP-binding protein [Oscillospiraceae bacterium]|nr:ABC transporter ATP-binding protein [Clostridiales bacterium]MCI7573294.1 ABC transporter ATP-binding protein [Clostridiales bacterium]MDD7673586.1 ABC transporter ATP-binding protein [Oscillospiraceae bacterium]MDY5641806.1 ABC transporter ATP-binding protein [Candidatus Faecousia sp.]
MRYTNKLALDKLTLDLPQGKIVGLLGPNGSGKTTFIKLAAGLLTPTEGTITICGQSIGPATKAIVSYLPDRPYFSRQMTVAQQLDFFQDFYADFDRSRAETMLDALGIRLDAKFRTLSKGTQEKVQLVLVMSRRAKLYLLDEPIGGVDPAARDYILNTIISNYDPSATILISTHLISDVERVLDEFIFLYQGNVVRSGNADETREETGKSLDELFREVFRCLPNC